jgi:hypothetical protein
MLQKPVAAITRYTINRYAITWYAITTCKPRYAMSWSETRKDFARPLFCYEAKKESRLPDLVTTYSSNMSAPRLRQLQTFTRHDECGRFVRQNHFRTPKLFAQTGPKGHEPDDTESPKKNLKHCILYNLFRIIKPSHIILLTLYFSTLLHLSSYAPFRKPCPWYIVNLVNWNPEYKHLASQRTAIQSSLKSIRSLSSKKP